MTSQCPILLFGMPRSGTTWIGKIFDSHPETLYRHEPDTEQALRDLPLMAGAKGSAQDREYLTSYLSMVARMRAERVAAKQPIFPKSYRSGLGTSLHRVSAAASKVAGRGGVSLPVLGSAAPPASHDYRLVWKSIESMGRLGMILWALPDARSIQILRHPCGYVNSVLRGESSNQFTHSGAAEDYELLDMLCRTAPAVRRELTLGKLKAMNPDERLAWRWVIFNEFAAEQAAPTGRNELLYYEELCSAPAEVTRRLFEFCGLSWNSQTEQFLEASTGSQKDGYYSVVKNPMDSAWKWRTQLNESAQARVLTIMRQSQLAQPYFDAHAWARKDS